MAIIYQFPTAEIIPDLDLDVEIDAPVIDKRLALALMRAIELTIQDYDFEEESPLLEDFYMDLQSEVWPDDNEGE